MALDWLTTLGVADQSLEGQLAKRDLGKKAALMQNLAKMQEDVRSSQEQEQFRRDQLKEQSLLRQATLSQSQAYHDQVEQDRKDAREAAAKVARTTKYNTIADNLRANMAAGGGAQTITDPAIADLIRENEGGAALTPMQQGEGVNQGSGEGQGTGLPGWYYQKEAAEKMLHDAEQKKNREEHSRKLADQAASLALQREQRQEQDAVRAKQMHDERLKALVANRKAAELRLKNKPGAAAAIGKRAKELIDQQKGIWAFLTGEQRDMTEAEAYNQAASEVLGQTPDAGGPEPTVAVPPGPPAGGGRGGQPGAGPAKKTTIGRFQVDIHP